MEEHEHQVKMGGGAKAVVAVLIVVAIIIPILLGFVLVHGSLPEVTSNTGAAATSSTGTSSTPIIIMPQGVGSDQSLNFQPSTIHLVIGVNNTVEFMDEDTTAPHNVWFTSVPTGATNPNTADSQTSFYQLNKGDSVTYTLTVAGTYDFECQFHSGWMQGTITVTG